MGGMPFKSDVVVRRHPAAAVPMTLPMIDSWSIFVPVFFLGLDGQLKVVEEVEAGVARGQTGTITADKELQTMYSLNPQTTS